MEDKPKVIVIGLDGATWDLIKPWADEGKLPTLKHLMENGAWGILESVAPHYTFPNWKCISTGKNPGRFGVYSWMKVDFEKKEIVPNNSKDFKSEEIWDILSDDGVDCGVIGMPTTYPPKKLENGFIVSEMSPFDYGFVYPNELENELKDEFNYTGKFIDFHGRKPLEVFQDRIDLINQRFDAAIYLYKKYNPTLFWFVVFPIDNIQHMFWEDKHLMKYAWQLIDKRLGEFIKQFVDNKTFVFLVSDHGFTGLKMIFNIHHWLFKKGYLKLSNILFEFMQKCKLWDKVMRVYRMYKNILSSILDLDIKTFDSLTSSKLYDWESSKVIPLNDGLLYLNPVAFSTEEEKVKFKRQLIKELSLIKDPRGKTLAYRVYDGKKLYCGPFIDTAPDVVIDPTEGYEILALPYFMEWAHDLKEQGWSGIHNSRGILLAYGPGVRGDHTIKKTNVFDLAPTILHILRAPIPIDIDGKVLLEIFKPTSRFRKYDVIYTESREKEKISKVISRLKSERKLI